LESRKYKRLIEQDALYAVVAARAPGTIIQRLEAECARAAELTRSVRTNQKKMGLTQKINSKKANHQLQSAISRLENNLEPGFKQYLLPKHDQEIINYIEHPHIFYPNLEKRIISDLSLLQV